MLTLKKCSKCKKNKSVNDFSPDKRNKTGLFSQCKTCRTKIEKNKRTQDPLKYKACQLKNKFNLTLEQYYEMHSQQHGLCLGCNSPISVEYNSSNIAVVDHCHKTGKVRGLLCSKCNLGLGHFNDDTKILKNLIKYLNKHVQ
ncbi:MAG: endonuclease VII domain-containing protein [Ignavibacteria bacterium]|nr:endonuclease VII domain-containing protein [Ignavibacteria bacterium]